MSEHPPVSPVLRFGAFELDRDAGELRKQGRLVALTGQPLRVLELLAANGGEVVSRKTLQTAIWGDDTHVDFDAGLATCINQVRVALGDRAAAPRFVETLPKRGYRFVAPVTLVEPVKAEPVVVEANASPQVGSGIGTRWLWATVSATVVVASVGIYSVVITPASAPSPLPIATSGPIAALPVVVVPVRVSRSLTALEPLAASLTDVLIGALSTKGGARLRVASPIAVRHLRGDGLTFDGINALGAKYYVTVTLAPIGDRINVHTKVSDIGGWILESTDHVFRPDELSGAQLQLADDLSSSLFQAIQRDSTSTFAAGR